ncbi:hypothetical protein OFO01_07160 [Campylobacter sp. JMF_01 NE2]|uniref:hypothetical protein n=1 Tax=unclassified Campylobacter TaxID=2593542 RepID=UPI0022EA049A|nr:MULTISPECIES: hypothetical protein [unclassified Campylobacter]MDA3053258.1 hypothetical protein [Campylobacter sp. JMF_03 NE3]MDA3067559.1 hypothetical protein [Campylobacter sp. JMF_01 NE2]
MKKFVLTQEDKEYLLKYGNLEQDLEQIEQGINVGVFKYKNRKISYKKAIELLGRDEFLSGASRASFHWNTSRETLNGDENVDFDFSDLFLPEIEKECEQRREQKRIEVKKIREICKKCSCRLYETSDENNFSLYCVIDERQDKEIYFISIDNFTAKKFTSEIIKFYNKKDLHGTLLERHAKGNTDNITDIFYDVKFAIDSLKALHKELLEKQ